MLSESEPQTRLREDLLFNFLSRNQFCTNEVDVSCAKRSPIFRSLLASAECLLNAPEYAYGDSLGFEKILEKIFFKVM